jgi:ribonuclease R
VLPRESEILERLRQKGARVLSLKDLAAAFHVRPEDEDELRERLDALERKGEIARVRGEKYSAIEFSNLIAGRLTVRPEGYGFVLVDGGPDLFVPRSGMHGAMDGDTVLAREERTRARQGPGGRGKDRDPGRISGVVVKVLARGRERVVGRFQAEDGHKVVLPYDPKIDAVVRITDGKTRGAREGEIVEARLTSFPDARRVAQGVVEEKLGFLGEPGVDIEIVLRSHGLPPRFPQLVVDEAEAFPDEVPEDELLGRRDFRDCRIVTIDGETARDFDDAVEVERTAHGFRLGVHIADVSRYVAEGTALDDEALSRGTSVYFPGRVLPMLPEHLSNGLCSLNPRVDRLVLSAILETDKKGRVTKSEFVKGVIRSAHRMTYTDVARLLETPHAGKEDEKRYGALLEDFKAMADLAALLRERREARGSIDFDLPDADIVLDDAGLVVGIVPESRNVAHRLIEEFMLAANEAVAKKLLFSRQPAIYRVHDAPDPDRLVDLREILQSFGYDLKGDLEEVPPSAFQRILKEVEGKPEERLLTDLLLRAQRKAIYSVECRGHYALAAPYYCHFTSPIRRYPDLIVHRQLTRLLDEGRPVAAKDFDAVNESLVSVAKLCSERERRAEQAERESLLWKKIVFMKDKVGRDFDAFVTGVTSFGLFVMLKDFFVEGLVPVSALGEDFFVYEEKQHRLRGRSSGKTFRLGDELQVKLAAIDEVRRRLDFRLPGSAEKPPLPASGRRPRKATR